MASAIKDTVNSVLSALHLSGSGDKADARPPPSDDELKELKEKFAKFDQEHVFEYYDQLSAADRATLYGQLETMDPQHIHNIANEALHPAKTDAAEGKAKVEQLPASATTSTIDSETEDLDKWFTAGLKLISNNKVAVVLMAGGQGTRLGSSAPKGCYDIGLPSKKSLFQLQAERILRLQHLASTEEGKDATIPWYIMTSGPTKEATQEFFDKHKYFGLNRNNVTFFEQGVLPCINMEGKIMLESKGRVAVAPDGNGGLYKALITSGAVQDMEKRGIEHVHAYCVDNCLVRVADPTFIGFAADKDVDIATKVVRKRDAKESVGLIVSKNNRPDVVEYSEIDSETAEAKDPKDEHLLKFRAANIVNHYYSFRFLQSIPEWAHKLPHHVAKKKIPSIPLGSKTGETEKPDKPNGIKLEQFVFDCFPFLPMEKFACQEVKREDEFSPLKNAPGSSQDCPETSRRDILSQGKRYLEAAGAMVTSEDADAGVEVSPLISYSGEGLDFLKGREIRAPAVIEKED